MSRDLRFRAWHKGANEMLQSRDQGYQGEVFKWLAERQPIEIMAFTGLTDKNGKDIFEGDLVKAQADGGRYFGEMTGLQVEYLDGSFQFLNIFDSTDGFFWYDLKSDTVEVIGNIYQDSHLLEEE